MARISVSRPWYGVLKVAMVKRASGVKQASVAVRSIRSTAAK